MTRDDIEFYANLRVDIAQALATVERRRERKYPPEKDTVETRAEEAIRCQLIALHTLLSVRLGMVAEETPPPPPGQEGPDSTPPQDVTPARAAAREKFAEARKRELLAMDLESGLELEFPSMSAALSMFRMCKSSLQNTLNATTAEDWHRGPEHLAKTPMRHCKGYAFIYKDALEAEDGR